MRFPLNIVHCFALGAMLLGSRLTIATRSGDEAAFQISTPLEFKGRVVSGSLRKSEIPALLDLPVRNGDTDPTQGFGVEMTRPNGEKFKASSCREWKNSQKEEAYSATTYDMAMESALVHTCGLLFHLQNARVPLKSFVANPRVTLADLNLIPAEILAADDGDEEGQKRLQGLTISKVVPKKGIAEAKDTALRLSFGGFRQSFREAARADFDGSGLEEIFVFVGVRAEAGTMGYAENLILSRSGPSGPLRLLQEEDSPGKH